MKLAEVGKPKSNWKVQRVLGAWPLSLWIPGSAILIGFLGSRKENSKQPALHYLRIPTLDQSLDKPYVASGRPPKIGRVKEWRVTLGVHLGCIHRFQLRARLGSP